MKLKSNLNQIVLISRLLLESYSLINKSKVFSLYLVYWKFTKIIDGMTYNTVFVFVCLGSMHPLRDQMIGSGFKSHVDSCGLTTASISAVFTCYSVCKVCQFCRSVCNISKYSLEHNVFLINIEFDADFAMSICRNSVRDRLQYLISYLSYLNWDRNFQDAP